MTTETTSARDSGPRGNAADRTPNRLSPIFIAGASRPIRQVLLRHGVRLPLATSRTSIDRAGREMRAASAISDNR